MVSSFACLPRVCINTQGDPYNPRFLVHATKGTVEGDQKGAARLIPYPVPIALESQTEEHRVAAYVLKKEERAAANALKKEERAAANALKKEERAAANARYADSELIDIYRNDSSALNPDEVSRANVLVKARDRNNENQAKRRHADSELIDITAMTVRH